MGTTGIGENGAIGFEERLAYDKLTFFYLSLPATLLGQSFGMLLLAALMLRSVDIESILVWLALGVVMVAYRTYHYLRFRRSSEYGKLADATLWLHKFYTDVLLSGIVWGSSALLIFPAQEIVAQLVIVVFLFAISFTSMGALASKRDLLLAFTLSMFLPVILRFFFLEGDELYTTLAYVVTALMLITLLIAYFLGGVVNESLRNHQYFIEIKQSHDQLKERFFSLFERAPVGIYYYGKDFKIQDLNSQFRAIHKAAFKEDLIGQETGPEANELLAEAHRDALKRRTGNYRGPYGRFFDDETIYVDLSTVPMLDNDGEVTGGITIIKDITAEVTAREEMLKNAYYDMLTEVPNRTLLMDRLEANLKRLKGTPGFAGLLFIDIDRFKNVNDTYGHNVGDTVIKQVAYRIEELIDERQTLARIGGDKFVVLLPELAGDMDRARHEAMQKALEIKRKFAGSLKISGEDYHITVSIGIALFHGKERNAFDVLKRAETAMYQSKRGGRNTVSVYNEGMGIVAEEQLQLQNDLFKALRHPTEELQVVYQPQLDIATGEIISAEALVRWFHPQKGPISPEKFVALAEESGMIEELEDWIFERVLMQMRQWSGRAGGFPVSHIAINVSAVHFLKPHFVERFMLLVNRYGVDPERIELELTEGEVMHNVREAIRRIEQLRAFGIAFSIDDFGTGYSSFSYLKQLPVNVLKIDQSFVLNMADNHEDAMIVSAIIAIAKRFGLTVLAEGVETRRTLELLREMSCDVYQGYFAYKPIDAEAFESALTNPPKM